MNIKEKLAEIISNFTEKSDVNENSSLSDLGLDSIDKANVLFEIEEEFNITFEDEEMFAFKTVNDVILAIQAKLEK